ncbi:MAG: PPC domain-containing protein [Pirellulaceae bacterium]|nr:PPC domain-containing protein [Pirellulaceae bacterium]
MLRSLFAAGLVLLLAAIAFAEPPHASYIFPAGGQRGQTVQVRIGGHFLHEKSPFELLGPGVSAPVEISRVPTVWFEGPLVKLPASQQAEDYPQDYGAAIQIAGDAPLGNRWWRCWNAQGVTAPLPFVVGALPEIVEQEIDGEPLPVAVPLPVTINGRIFPREDSDLWSFDATAGQPLTLAVAAAELGSPLVARIEVRDAAGKLLAESIGAGNRDAWLRFVPPADGKYSVRISDVASGGLQHFVYRLTITTGPWVDHVYPLGGRQGQSIKLSAVGQALPGVLEFNSSEAALGIARRSLPVGKSLTNAILLDLGDLPELLEAEPNDGADKAAPIALPATINGRIQSPGDVDFWSLALAKGKPIVLDARVTRLGSPLALVLTVRDQTGKQLAQGDGSAVAAGDVSLTFNPPADGTYLVEISERFSRRGGPAFAYRVQISEPAADFRLLAPDLVSVDVGAEKKLDVTIERRGDWKTPLVLHVAGLPAGVTCEDVTVPPNAPKGSLVFKCAADAAVISQPVTITGRAEVNGQMLERTALCAGQKDGFAKGEAIPTRLAITLPTPFKFTAPFSFIYTARGAVLHKKYTIERNGFEGPLVARLADRQGRHLQGVTGPEVAIPAGATEFDYPLYLPPWMELGRTSRTNLMLTGELKDAAGKLHKVCYTTKEQNEQLIALVSPAALRLGLEKSVVAIPAGGELAVAVAIKRDAAVKSFVRLALVVPPHMRGISAEPVVAPAEATEATLLLQIDDSAGPFNMPVLIRATAERAGQPLVAEIPLELLAEKSSR